MAKRPPVSVLAGLVLAMTWVGGGPTAMCLAQDAPLHATWQCLPEETVFAVRIPDGSTIAAAITNETKLGSVLFSDERMERLKEFVSEQEVSGEQTFADVLAEEGLSVDDLGQILAGETGYAVLVDSEQEESPLVVGIGWAQPGAELAQRLLQSIQRSLDDQSDDEPGVERVDLELEGYEVMQLTFPHVDVSMGDYELPEDFDELSEEEQRIAHEEAFEKARENSVSTVTFSTALVTQLADRLLVVHTFPPEEERREGEGEQLESIMARLLNAHTEGPTGFLARIEQTPGMDVVTDTPGLVLLDAICDLDALRNLLRTQSEFQELEEGEDLMQAMGLDQPDMVAFKMTLDQSLVHQRLFLSVPAPRRGLMRFLDQEPIPIDPPAWVPSSAISYSQFSFDLGKAYEILREVAMNTWPDEAAAAFNQADEQVENFIQATVEELTRSLGTRHRSISFTPQIVEQQIADDVSFEQPTDRTAVVWEIKDEDLWARILRTIGTFSAFVDGLEATEERGFSGWRMSNDSFEGGLVYGKGYLVLGVGNGVLETTLATLTDPPQGKDAFRNGELMDRASQLIELRPAVGFEIADGDAYAKAIFPMFRSMIEQIENFSDEFDEDDTSDNWLEAAKIFLPEDEEVENVLGIAVTEYHVDDNGFVLRSVNVLPPPQE